ncbi:MAG: hypothetical protein U5K31_07595 [Balneolaceae bacterium]|nr:hypothetical protein [Balneolaceae bacterium]
MLRFFKEWLSNGEASRAHRPELDLPSLIGEIRQRESGGIERGRRIHQFTYGIFEVRLDRDITGHYRVTVYNGRERVYSFTVKAEEGQYEELQTGYRSIINFLDGERRLSELPDSPNLKGHFYGHE